MREATAPNQGDSKPCAYLEYRPGFTSAEDNSLEVASAPDLEAVGADDPRFAAATTARCRLEGPTLPSEVRHPEA